MKCVLGTEASQTGESGVASMLGLEADRRFSSRRGSVSPAYLYLCTGAGCTLRDPALWDLVAP